MRLCGVRTVVTLIFAEGRLRLFQVSCEPGALIALFGDARSLDLDDSFKSELLHRLPKSRDRYRYILVLKLGDLQRHTT